MFVETVGRRGSDDVSSKASSKTRCSELILSVRDSEEVCVFTLLSPWQTTQVLRPRNSYEKLARKTPFVCHAFSHELVREACSELVTALFRPSFSCESRTSFLDGELGSSVMGFTTVWNSVPHNVILSQSAACVEFSLTIQGLFSPPCFPPCYSSASDWNLFEFMQLHNTNSELVIVIVVITKMQPLRCIAKLSAVD